MSERDRDLGLDRAITRRDFVNGALTTGLALAAPASGAQAAESTAGPASGSATAHFAGQSLAAAAVLHALRDGAQLPPPLHFARGGEQVDLVVVGAGISGLAAARLYRRHASGRARVLVLEAQPDIGGHALRNEFTAANGRRVIGYGGSEALDSPSLWSPAMHELMRDVGIDLAAFDDYYDAAWAKRHGLDHEGIYFAPAPWGGSGTLVTHPRGEAATAWIGRTPLNEAARHDYVRLTTPPLDPWPGLGRVAKCARLAAMTYDRFVVDALGLHPQITQWMRHRTQALLGAGTDACSALDAWALGLPGFDAMKLGDAPDRALSPTARQAKIGKDRYIYHFPDGNAGVVRALLRKLIPDALPGSGTESLVLAIRDDAQLDLPGAPVRIRVGCTVTNVRHVGTAERSTGVDVSYVDAHGRMVTVRARHVVLACFARVASRICPGLVPAQAAALDDQVKVPLMYGNVLLGRWHAFQRARIAGFELPGQLWSHMRLDMPVSIGRYRFAGSPDDPVLLQMSAVVLGGAVGSPARDQAAAGRRRLMELRFEDVERDIRSVLQGALGAFGFDAARDIEALTLNRWAHGYAYEYMRPWDTYWPDGPLPIVHARQRFGRVAFANADAGAFAYAQGAVDQATRAVGELLPNAKLPAYARVPGPSLRALGFSPRR